eukprot:s1_g880.t1
MKTSVSAAEPDRKILRRILASVFAALLIVTSYFTFDVVRSNYILNFDDNMPVGLYRLIPEPIDVGSIVRFRPPIDVARQFETDTGRPYAPHGFLQTVYRMGPFQLCPKEDGLYLDDELLPPSEIPPVPIRFCRTYPGGWMYIMSTSAPRSYDSRHYGPIAFDRIAGSYAAIFTW